MVLEKLFEHTIEHKLCKIETLLTEKFQYELAYPTDVVDMETVLSTIKSKKHKIMIESNYNEFINNKTYIILNLAEQALSLKIQIEGQNEENTK